MLYVWLCFPLLILLCSYNYLATVENRLRLDQTRTSSWSPSLATVENKLQLDQTRTSSWYPSLFYKEGPARPQALSKLLQAISRCSSSIVWNTKIITYFVLDLTRSMQWDTPFKLLRTIKNMVKGKDRFGGALDRLCKALAAATSAPRYFHPPIHVFIDEHDVFMYRYVTPKRFHFFSRKNILIVHQWGENNETAIIEVTPLPWNIKPKTSTKL